MTIDVAVFGAGRIGKIHAANLARQPGVRLKYVVDVNRDAAAALAAQHGAQVADVDGAMGDASIGATVDLFEHRYARRPDPASRPRRRSMCSARSRSI